MREIGVGRLFKREKEREREREGERLCSIRSGDGREIREEEEGKEKEKEEGKEIRRVRSLEKVKTGGEDELKHSIYHFFIY